MRRLLGQLCAINWAKGDLYSRLLGQECEAEADRFNRSLAPLAPLRLHVSEAVKAQAPDSSPEPAVANNGYTLVLLSLVP